MRLIPIVALVGILAIWAPACGLDPQPRALAPPAHLTVPEQGLAAAIDPFTCTLESSPWRASLTLARFGRSDDARTVGDGAVSHHAQRVTVDRGTWTAWYETTEQGLEQGFDVFTPPPGDGPLVIDMEVAGLTPHGTEQQVRLYGGAVHRLTMGKLYAFDAVVQRLPSRFVIEGSRVRIEIDDTGATYPVMIDPLMWTPHQTITPTLQGADDRFGWAMDLDDGVLVVGAPWASSASGEVVVFRQIDGEWTEEEYLGSPTSARLGFSVSIDGDTVATGDPFSFEQFSYRGAVHVFVRVGEAWAEQQRIVAPTPEFADDYGHAVALDGDTLAVGSPNDEEGGIDGGSVFVYVRTGTTWTLEQQLLASDRDDGDGLGFSVALHGDTLIAGAWQDDGGRGAAYVFTRSAGAWTEQQKLTEPTRGVTHYFGFDVDIDAGTLVVGSERSESIGAVDVFDESAGTWIHAQHINAVDGEIDERFGGRVALDGDRMLVSASRDDTTLTTLVGSMYIFERSGGVWQEIEKLAPADGANGDRFGGAVALSGDIVAAGAPDHDTDGIEDAGAAYIWTLTGGACSGAASCGSGYCADGVCCATACEDPCGRCDGPGLEGTCTPVPAMAPAVDCAPFLCDGLQIACPTTCTSDAQCTSEAFCFIPPELSSGVCALAGPDGSACISDAQCESERCVDGLCCGICDRPCAGCDDDICGPLPAGTPGGCVTFVCDGTSTSCPEVCTSDAQCPAGLRCDTFTGACTSANLCDGDHTILSQEGPVDCTPYRCGADANCLNPCTSTADCVAGYVCDPDGACAAGEVPVVVTGCTVARGPRAPTGAFPLLLAGLAVWMRRRRRR